MKELTDPQTDVFVPLSPLEPNLKLTSEELTKNLFQKYALRSSYLKSDLEVLSEKESEVKKDLDDLKVKVKNLKTNLLHLLEKILDLKLKPDGFYDYTKNLLPLLANCFGSQQIKLNHLNFISSDQNGQFKFITQLAEKLAIEGIIILEDKQIVKDDGINLRSQETKPLDPIPSLIPGEPPRIPRREENFSWYPKAFTTAHVLGKFNPPLFKTFKDPIEGFKKITFDKDQTEISLAKGYYHIEGFIITLGIKLSSSRLTRSLDNYSPLYGNIVSNCTLPYGAENADVFFLDHGEKDESIHSIILGLTKDWRTQQYWELFWGQNSANFGSGIGIKNNYTYIYGILTPEDFKDPKTGNYLDFADFSFQVGLSHETQKESYANSFELSLIQRGNLGAGMFANKDTTDLFSQLKIVKLTDPD